LSLRNAELVTKLSTFQISRPVSNAAISTKVAQYLERIYTSRMPKQALNFKPKRNKNIGRPTKG
jgi:hypothetical protein